MADGLDDWCLSVFVDNAGIVGFDEDTAVCMKVETHNHPSALEPYGGAATGIGAYIRAINATGLAAHPLAARLPGHLLHEALGLLPLLGQEGLGLIRVGLDGLDGGPRGQGGASCEYEERH